MCVYIYLGERNVKVTHGNINQNVFITLKTFLSFDIDVIFIKINNHLP